MSDDFDDFGGFEAADPSEAEELGAETTPSFLLPTNLFNSSQTGGSTPSNSAADNEDAEQITQGSNTDGANTDLAAVDWNSSTQLNWGSPESDPITKTDDLLIASSIQPAGNLTIVNKQISAVTSIPPRDVDVHSKQDSAHSTSQNAAQPPQQSSSPIPISDSTLTDLRNQLRLAEMKNKQLTTELDELRKSHNKAQELHSKQMESLQLSHESSLTQMITQHESMCKQAVLEQQKLCVSEFSNLIKDELEKYERSHHKQEAVFEEWKLKSQSDNKNSQTEQLNELKSVIEEKIELIKSDISSRLKLELSTLDTKSDEIRDRLKQEVESQKTEIISQLKEELQEVIVDKVNQQKEEITEILRGENSDNRQLAMEFWTAHSKDLLESAEKLLNATLNKHNERLDEYIENKLQIDSAQRERQLSAVDVYLDAAKKQLKTLITSSSAH